MPRTPWPPRAWPVEPVHLGPLAVAGIGHDQDVGVVPGDVARDDLVLGLEAHTPYAGGVPTHGPDVLLAEADRHARRRDDEHVVVAVGLDHPDQFVAVAEVDGDEALATRLVVLAEGRLLDLAVLGGEHQEVVGGEVAGADDGLDALVRARAAAG